MRWYGLQVLCSSFPNFVFLRLVVLLLARNIIWLVSGFSGHIKSLWVIENWLAFAAVGFCFVTGFPLRQLSNLLGNICICAPASKVPGPLLAKGSRVWKIWQVLRGDFNTTIRELHRRYGPIVQIAPDEYSFSEPAVIDQIYRGPASGWRKADWYHTGGPPDAETQGLFNNRDAEAHGRIRRRLAPGYRKDQIYQLEPLLDGSLKELQHVLDGAARTGHLVNLAKVFELFAFDATGALTNGNGFGALRGNHVPPMILEALDLTVLYVALIGNIPEWHTIIFNLMQFPGLPNMLPLVEDFIEKNTESRLKEGANVGKSEDMLSRFLPTALGQSTPKQTHEALRQMVETNALAAADTTSTAMCSAVQYLSTHAWALGTLREHLQDSQHDDGTRLRVRSTSAVYLDAVVKEAMRLHPGVGLNMPRVIPTDGAVVSGRHFPPGSLVGTNAWLMHHDDGVWGSDHEAFRPERWLSDDETALKMNRTFFSFGAGSRECIGKNIAMMEMQRLVAFLVLRYDFEIEDENVSWRCMQFTQFSKMMAKVKLRPEAK